MDARVSGPGSKRWPGLFYCFLWLVALFFSQLFPTSIVDKLLRLPDRTLAEWGWGGRVGGWCYLLLTSVPFDSWEVTILPGPSGHEKRVYFHQGGPVNLLADIFMRGN